MTAVRVSTGTLPGWEEVDRPGEVPDPSADSADEAGERKLA